MSEKDQAGNCAQNQQLRVECALEAVAAMYAPRATIDEVRELHQLMLDNKLAPTEDLMEDLVIVCNAYSEVCANSCCTYWSPFDEVGGDWRSEVLALVASNE